MADFGAPASANYTAPDGLATLGNLMSIKQKQQGLQSGALSIQSQQQGLQGQAADVQMAQQSAAQRKGLANIDWNKHLSPDGILDTNSFAKDQDIRKAAGDQYPDLLAKANQVKQSQLQNQQSLFNLTKDQAGTFGSIVGGLQSDKDVQEDNEAGRQKVSNAFAQYGQMYGPEAAAVAQTYSPMVEHAPKGQLASSIHALQLQTQSAGQQIGTTTPGGATVQGKRGLNVINTNPNAPQPVGSQVGQPITDQGISPTLAIMPNKTLQVVGPSGPAGSAPVKAPSGPGTDSKAHGGSSPAPIRTAQDDAPPANSPDAIHKAYNDSVISTQQHVSGIRAADSEYGNNISISNTIRHLSQNTKTGPGTSQWQTAMAALGVKSGSDYQELGAFLDRQAAGLRSQMGLPGTNAGAQDSKDIAGNTTYTKQTIQDKNDYSQALVEGAHQYRHGLDRVAGFGSNASPKAVQAYQSAWTDNFDPNVYKLDIMKKQGKEALNSFISKLDPSEAASLSVKRKNLQALSNGQVPQ